MTALQFLKEKQEEHFKLHGVYADVDSKIAQWMEEYKNLDNYTDGVYNTLLNNINRVEVINHNSSRFDIGCIFSFRGNIELQLQDNNKTIKVFI